MKPWQKRAISDAAQHPDANYSMLARWASVHASTLKKAKARDPEFRAALEAARSGSPIAGEAVDFLTFIRSPEYLGLGIKGDDENGSVLPVIAEEARNIVEGNYSVVLLTGSLGSGKTYCSALCLCYITYRLLLEPNPQQRLGLDPNTSLIISVQSQSQKKAKQNDFVIVRRMIEGSKWFQIHAPMDDRLKAKIVFLGRNIEVRPAGPDASELIGENIFTGLIDEANFFQVVQNSTRAVNGRDYDQARSAFEGLLRRQQSRFSQGLAGPIFIASSSRYSGDFTSQILKDFQGSKSLYVFRHTAWSSNPERFRHSKWFRIFSGDRLRPPRILGDDEVLDRNDEKHVIDVPVEFKRSFMRDPVGSLMEIAGHSAEVFGGYLTDMEALAASACLEQNIFSTTDVTKDARLLLGNPDLMHFADGKSPRHVHLDLALTGDCAAIGIGHIAKYNGDGHPLINIDALGRVHPPDIGEIFIDGFVQLIAQLKSLGLAIASVSADGFQSYDAMQRLQRLGLRVGRLSVDQTEVTDPMRAYETLRTAINEYRFRFPDDPATVEELKLLQIDRKASRGLGKVDHLPGKTKDTSDCLAAIAFYLTHKIQPWTLVDKVEGAGLAAAVSQPEIGGQVTPIKNLGIGAGAYMEMLRNSRGVYR